ncbi:ABC transporter permease subunit [Amycolatopsis vastitatis]|uniref:Branched-chain amino acid ABC transporter permease/ATP-binding protein n=1 Tax=Amycolatopsis vastitatis TaxID=1905142 RepID=A0A229SZB1_9PSEU|nr:ATP-binding cassette domain-containing protein [Amycolatopsis vastitatis]OXM64080.1 branched-chain amino acid ABC transporter permease/ATP-binding protein [Amycolatopsis vastitatis]
MLQLLPFVVAGIAAGAIYGLAGTGLVLTYKSSGIFNFGHGAIATVAAYVFYALHTGLGLHWVLALIAAVGIAGPVIGLLMEVIAARLAPQRVALQIVGTVGIILAVQGLATLGYGANTIQVDQWLPAGQATFRLLGTVVTWGQVTIVAIAVVAVAALYAMFRFSRIGLAMRAVVDDPDLLAMQATDPRRVRRIAWVIGSTFTALSGVLVMPLIGLDAVGLTFLVVQAFGAAAVGAFGNIPLTFAGGLVIGIASAVSQHYVLDVPWLSGLPSALPFLVLFVTLLVLPKRKLVRPSTVERRPPPAYRAPGRVRLVVGAAVLAVLVLLPGIVGPDTLPYWIAALIGAIMLLSLGLLVRTSGQVSLCHAAFAAIGAVAFSQFAVDLGLPWVVSLVLGGLVVVPVGALVALPAIRLSGLFLALATFGFGILVQQLLYHEPYMFTSLSQGRTMPRPDFAPDDGEFYYVVLAVLVVVAVLLVTIQRGRLGRLLQGMSDSPTAVTSMGLSTTVSKVIVFCVSAFLAGIAGALLGVARMFAVGSDVFFQPFTSLQLLAQLSLAPLAEPWFALIALTNVIPGYVPGDGVTEVLGIVFGVAAVLVAVRGGGPPMPLRLRVLLDRFGGRRREVPVVSEAPVHVVTGGAGVSVRGLSVSFGGLVAVENLSFDAPVGRITGLIGPNGAGKTTTFDACSGLNRRFAGQVLLHARDVTRMAPARRGRSGIGRTFQRMELCETLTVAQNVVLGRECAQAGAGVLAQLVARPAERKAAEAAAWSAMELCGITHLAREQAGTLSTGQRRLVELARCLAGPFDVLLLDEPSSGLDHDETERFGEILRRVVEDRGVGVLLVEHDIALVMRICADIYVLDFGRLLFHGTPAEVSASPAVQAAYLGSDEPVPTLESR